MGDPGKEQLEILQRLIRRNERCAFARAHDFGRIRSYEQFADNVPLAAGDDFEPWIARIAKGESAVLTDDRVTHLVPTSGSTSARKLIPFTAGLQAEFNAAIGAWMLDLAREHPGILHGPAYWSISPALADSQDGSSVVPTGFDEDACYLAGAKKWLASMLMAVPGEVRLIQDIECFRHVTAYCLLRERNLRLISVWHPSFLALLLDAIEAGWNELIEDIHTGKNRFEALLPSRVNRVLRAGPDRARARELSTLNPSDPESWWPQLRLVSCWGDGPSTFAMAELRKRFRRVRFQPKGLLATEAFVSIPYAGLHPLALTSHFLEFIDPSGRIRLASDLVANEIYEVVVTTGGGLWRYRLGDLVEVNGFVGAAPSVRFAGRAGCVSDLCGEKLSEGFVARVVQAALNELELQPRFVLLAPEQKDGRWRYTLFVQGIADFRIAATVDSLLRENPHYACCRDLGQLDPVALRPVAGDAHALFVSTEAGRGRRLGEIKPRWLSVHADWSKVFRCSAECAT